MTLYHHINDKKNTIKFIKKIYKRFIKDNIYHNLFASISIREMQDSILIINGYTL